MKNNSSLIIGLALSVIIGTFLSLVPTESNSRTVAGVFDKPSKKTALEKLVEFSPRTHVYVQKDKFN